MTFKEEIADLKDQVEDLKTRLELRDRIISEAKKRADVAEAECERLKAVVDNTIESENLTIEKLTLTEIELDNERQLRQKVERLLDIEKAMVRALEDVVRATAALRQQT